MTTNTDSILYKLGVFVGTAIKDTKVDLEGQIANIIPTPEPYSLPTASETVLGGVKVGSGLAIDPVTGLLSATGETNQATYRAGTITVASNGQTVFTVPNGGYTAGFLDVFVNGIRFVAGDDFTATNGTTFTLASGVLTTDTVEYVAWGTFSVDSHTQPASTITDFAEAVDDRVAALLAAGSNVTLTYSDATGTLTISAEQPTLSGLGGVAKTGDTMTGDLTLNKLRTKGVVDKIVTNSTATGTVTLDLSAASFFDLTLSGNTTISLSNLPTLSNDIFAFCIRVTQGATARTFTHPSGTTYLTPTGTAPTVPTAGKTAEYVYTTKDGSAFVCRETSRNF